MGFDYFSGMIAMRIIQNFALVFILKMIVLTVGILLCTWAVSYIPNNKAKQVISI